jgi:hypothetical protein
MDLWSLNTFLELKRIWKGNRNPKWPTGRIWHASPLLLGHAAWLGPPNGSGRFQPWRERRSKARRWPTLRPDRLEAAGSEGPSRPHQEREGGRAVPFCRWGGRSAHWFELVVVARFGWRRMSAVSFDGPTVTHKVGECEARVDWGGGCRWVVLTEQRWRKGRQRGNALFQPAQGDSGRSPSLCGPASKLVGGREVAKRPVASELEKRIIMALAKCLHGERKGRSQWRRLGGARAAPPNRATGRVDCSPDDLNYFQKFKPSSNCLKLERLKWCLPHLEKFQIKYGHEGFEVRNNFPYWNVSKFRIEFELKIKEAL